MISSYIYDQLPHSQYSCQTAFTQYNPPPPNKLWLQAMDQGNLIGVTFLDFCKVFNIWLTKIDTCIWKASDDNTFIWARSIQQLFNRFQYVQKCWVSFNIFIYHSRSVTGFYFVTFIIYSAYQWSSSAYYTLSTRPLRQWQKCIIYWEFTSEWHLWS